MSIPEAVQHAVQQLPDWVKDASGAVFYTSRAAFSQPSDLYILGLNPGGDPAQLSAATIRNNLDEWFASDREYSEYLDGVWGKVPGEHGLQPRVRHLFERLGRNLRSTPASNLIFTRSRTEALIGRSKVEVVQACWPVHQAVIDTLRVKTVICFGRTSGDWTRSMMNAHSEFDSFQEQNRRRWKSRAYRGACDRIVISLTHPSRADWAVESTDPSALVRKILS